MISRRYKIAGAIILVAFLIAAFYVAAYGGIRGTLLKFKAPDFSTLEANINEFKLKASDNLRTGPNATLLVQALTKRGNQTGPEHILQVTAGGQVKKLRIRSASGRGGLGRTEDRFDSAVWFAFPRPQGYEIVGIDGRGAFRLFKAPVVLPEGPGDLIPGIGNSIWFNKGGFGIGSISSSGRVETVSPLQEEPNLTVSGLARGTEGSILAGGTSGSGRHFILKIDQAGEVKTIRLPNTSSFGAINALSGCSDGNAWFSMDSDLPRLGHLDTQGTFKSWTVPSPPRGSIDIGPILCEPGGNLWFKEIWQTTVNGSFGQSIRDVGMIGRLTPRGRFDRVVVPSFTFFPPDGLALGTDEAVWYKHRNGVGRLVISK